MYASGEELAISVLMEHQVDDRLVLLVEGDEECALIDIHLDDTVGNTIDCGGKPTALEAANALSALDIDWFICIVDADFAAVLDRGNSWPPNVVSSEHYDLLMDAISLAPRVVEGAAITHSKPRRLKNYQRALGQDLDAFISKSVVIVGKLRYLAVTRELLLTVRKWQFSGLSLLTSDEDRREAHIQHAVLRAGGRHSAEDIVSALEKFVVAGIVQEMLLISSHDYLGMLTDVVRQHGGGRIGVDELAASIRLALTCQEFNQLAVVGAVSRWASDYHRATLFRCLDASN